MHAAIPHGIPVVVDDGSHDDTVKQARRAGADVVIRERNEGYDSALDHGFARAADLGCSYCLTMDADGQHDSNVLHKFVDALEDGADIVAGVRDRHQRLAEHLFAVYTKVRWGLQDPLCGLKAYRMEIYGELGHFDSYSSIGTELLLYGARQKKRIEQIPVQTHNRDDASRFGGRLMGNLRIFRAILRSIL